MLLSVIIPAHKQEKTIYKNIAQIDNTLSQSLHQYEILVVVDGMVDKTFENAKKYQSKKLKVLGYEQNQGKGYAVRFGMENSKGDLVGFIDAGMELAPTGLAMLLEHLKWYNADIIIGSKRHPVSKVTGYLPSRRFISWTSQLFIRTLFGLGVRDTQVGLKFFKSKVLKEILPKLKASGFAFDIEILAVAHRLGFKRIFEAPIELKFRPKNSTVSASLWLILTKTFLETLAIFHRLKILRYYDSEKSSR